MNQNKIKIIAVLLLLCISAAWLERYEIQESGQNLSGQMADKMKQNTDEPQNLYAQSAVLMDADSGRVLFGKEDKFMNEYKYEDIQSVELLLKHRYESYGTPIAKDWYVLDYRFEFKDGNHFYFYWPFTIDDDARFIGMILDEKVENVIDKDHVIEALKNGIHLNDYMKKTED